MKDLCDSVLFFFLVCLFHLVVVCLTVKYSELKPDPPARLDQESHCFNETDFECREDLIRRLRLSCHVLPCAVLYSPLLWSADPYSIDLFQ